MNFKSDYEKLKYENKEKENKIKELKDAVSNLVDCINILENKVNKANIENQHLSLLLDECMKKNK